MTARRLQGDTLPDYSEPYMCLCSCSSCVGPRAHTANCDVITSFHLQSELVHRMLPADVKRGHDVHESL